jgi:hypothetical protein
MLAILNPARAHSDPGRRPAVLAVGALVAVTLLVMPYAPQWIVFENPRSTPARAAVMSLPAAAKVASPVPGNPAAIHPAGKRPMLVAASAKARAHPRPAPLLAKARERAPFEPGGIVVFESTRFDDSGALVSHVSVWRVSVDGRRSFEQMIVLQVI